MVVAGRSASRSCRQEELGDAELSLYADSISTVVPSVMEATNLAQIKLTNACRRYGNTRQSVVGDGDGAGEGGDVMKRG
jgi:hypothetical protein